MKLRRPSLEVQVPAPQVARCTAAQIRPGNRVRIGNLWRAVQDVSVWRGTEHTWVHVDWAGSVASRTVYHSATRVQVQRGLGVLYELSPETYFRGGSR